jgi:toxin-antitoxin system PIN domain toxin
MLSFDTNLVVYALNHEAQECEAAQDFFDQIRDRVDVVVCDLMLIEVYLKLCNKRILQNPLSPREASSVCVSFRSNPKWHIVESAPVMKEVWEFAAKNNFAFRRIVDVRLALTLRHHGVTEFATSNAADFLDLGFEKLWNPIQDISRP